MAVTLTYGQAERFDRYTIQKANIAFDSSYSANGEDVSGENWSSNDVINVLVDPLASNATYYFWYDDATDVVYASTRADGEEVADTTDLSAVSVPVWIVKHR